jgi:hypothetical protein
MTPAQTPVDSRWYGAASGHVAWFLHHLCCIPASMWLAAADRYITIEDLAARASDWVFEEQADYAARRRLHTAIDAMPVVARRIRDRVNGELAVFDGMLPANAVQRMRRVAHLAAFALAACPQLSCDDLRRLYRPFADLIPAPRDLLPE